MENSYLEYKRMKGQASTMGLTEIVEASGEAPATVEKMLAILEEPTIARLIALTGLKVAEFARFFGIPLRTVEDWKSGRRQISGWTFDLLAAVVLENFGQE